MSPKAKKTLKAVNKPMHIFIRLIPMGDRIPLVVKGSDTIDHVKTMIANGPWHILENEQVLKLCGQQLEDGRTLSHYNIQNNMILTCHNNNYECLSSIAMQMAMQLE